MTESSFQDLFCRRHALSPDRYERRVLQMVLYPHARWLYGLIRLLRPNHFVADLDLVRGVAKLKRLRDFTPEVEEFVHHPANRGVLRRTFNVRVSTKCLRRLVRDVLHPEGKPIVDVDDHSVAPFPKSEEAQGGKPPVRLTTMAL